MAWPGITPMHHSIKAAALQRGGGCDDEAGGESIPYRPTTNLNFHNLFPAY
jgi:hypothetical protein